MPPPRATVHRSEDVWLFKRAHPFATIFLVNSARMTQPLLLLTMVANSSLLRSWPKPFPPSFKAKSFIWYLAYVSFFSRHLLALLSLTWLFRSDRGPRNAPQQNDDNNNDNDRDANHAPATTDLEQNAPNNVAGDAADGTLPAAG